MQKFWQDLLQQLYGYYDWWIALLPRLAMAMLFMALCWLVAGRVRALAGRRLSRRMDDPLLADFIAGLMRYAILVVGLLVVFSIIGLAGAAAGIMAGAGVGAFIIGFAFKDIGENFLAGTLMAFQRPFRIGDTVQLAGVEGNITGLSLRATQLKTFDGKDVFIPNGLILRQPIYNYTIDGFRRFDFSLNVDYQADLAGVIDTIQTALNQTPNLLQTEKPPLVVVNNLDAGTAGLTVYFWINTFDKAVSGLVVKSDAIRLVVRSLKNAGFQPMPDAISIHQI